MTVERHEITSREQWLALRAADVTASDISAICGIDPYRTALRVFAEKTGMIEPEPESEIMRRGRWFEAAILEALAELEPSWVVRKASVYLRDPETGIGCTPDAVAIDPEREGFGNLQLKTVALRVFNDRWCDPEDPERITPPLHYQLQSLVEAKMMGASWAAVVPLVVGEFTARVHVCPVALHDGAWQRVRDEVRYFRRCVEAGVQPELDAARDYETVKALYPRPAETEEPLDLTADNELPVALDEREGLKERIREAEQRIREIDTRVLFALKDQPAARLPGWRISYRTEKRRETVIPASERRVLRIRKEK